MKKIFTFFILVVSNFAVAQQPVQDFTLQNVRDGKPVSLSNYAQVKAVVLVFTSHECPFDNYYKDRIKEYSNAYAGRVQFIFINSNTEAEENAEQMAIHYTDFSIPYLSDKDQVVMNSLGAKKTPEVFLLTQTNGKFAIVYNGAIDDNPQSAKEVRNHFLKNAIESVVGGANPAVASERASGCTIRKK